MSFSEPDLREIPPEIADFPTCVRQALESMRTPRQESPAIALYALSLVQHIAAQLDFLSGDFVYQQALEYLLATLMTTGLAHHRRIMGFPAPRGTETRQQALEALVRDTRSGSRELLSWGLLFYHYVRVDLDFTSPQLGRTVNLDERSLRRYRRLGIQRLADWLLRAELRLRLGDADAQLNDLFAYHPLDRIVDLNVLLESLPTNFTLAPAYPRLDG